MHRTGVLQGRPGTENASPVKDAGVRAASHAASASRTLRQGKLPFVRQLLRLFLHGPRPWRCFHVTPPAPSCQPSCGAQVWPARVPLCSLSGASVRVVSVSCGPYHSAAVSSAGVLHTWGDGLFGKLGHGSHDSCASPRVVEALRGSWVASVACGWWHTAAVAVPREELSSWRRSSLETTWPGPGPALHGSSGAGAGLRGELQLAVPDAGCCWAGAQTSIASGPALSSSPWQPPPLARDTEGRKRHTSAPPRWPPPSASTGGLDCPLQASWPGSRAGQGLAGSLYTWGGDFTWQLRGSCDDHRGCLGHGDLAGRQLPEQVAGVDGVRQVRAGNPWGRVDSWAGRVGWGG
jgi:hypothetical protein